MLLIVCGIFLWKRYSKPKPYLAADDTLAVHFIDVGQGDCTLLACDGRIMLIDCGEYQYLSRVTKYLSARGIKRIDCLVATHPHSDHMGGMAGIVKDFDIGEVIVPPLDDWQLPTAVYYEKFLDACADKGLQLTQAVPGYTVSLGDARAEVIAPAHSGYEDLNDSSVAFMVTHGSVSLLLTGDAETQSEHEMIGGGRLRHVNVYKAGHHGSSSSSSEALLAAVTPDIAVISCGKDNSYGHPSASVLKRLRRYTDRIYRTDKDGTVVLESDGKVLRIIE
ncbi:MAG: MBL fold metallo-hydrolase [Ruminococcus sp.]|nr:MBL fold metallo-hydrolase [Ruminococcus sp.]